MFKKWIVVIICLINVSYTRAQIQSHLIAATGFNRLGLAYDFGIRADIGSLLIQLNARLYEPDFVFEKNVPGAVLGLYYRYPFNDSKWSLLVGGECAYFQERKESNRLSLVETKLGLGASYQLTNRWLLVPKIGVGVVYNKVETPFDLEQNTFTYNNYEIQLGIHYRLFDHRMGRKL